MHQSSEQDNYYEWYYNVWCKNYLDWMMKSIIANFYDYLDSRKRKALTAVILSIEKNRDYEKKKYWVAPIFRKRNTHGFLKTVFPILHMEDLRFYNYLRMSATQLESLSMLIEHDIYKQQHLREPIQVRERIVITLRFLASGDSIHSLSYQYLVGLTTISNIIKETTEAIWNNLHPIILESNISQEKWLSISSEFERQWNFPHCIGAIDGKHIVMQCPNNSGSIYYNYKGTHSIVLLAICDANYKFIYVDIGSYGRRSDGGIFVESIFKRKIENQTMNIPPLAPIEGNGKDNYPYFIVGDEAFPLKTYLLRPYPGKAFCNKEQRVFNYRLSRARRTIENAFGILANKWQLFREPIRCSSENTIKIVKAAVCLHNWLRSSDLQGNENMQYIQNCEIDAYRIHQQDSAFNNINNATINSTKDSKQAIALRNKLCKYFNNEGAVQWQYKYI